MLFTVPLILLSASLASAQRCSAPPADCASVTGDVAASAQCDAERTTSRPVCTTTITVPGSVETVSRTSVVRETTTETVSTTRTFLVTKQRSTTTTTTSVIATLTGTSLTTLTLNPVVTNTQFTDTTVATTQTVTVGNMNLRRLRNRNPLVVVSPPAYCSCFATSTSTVTRTGRATRTTVVSTVTSVQTKKTTTKTSTSTTFFGATSTSTENFQTTIIGATSVTTVDVPVTTVVVITSTSVSVTTLNVTPAPNTDCGNGFGMEYAVQPYPTTDSNLAAGYSNFPVASFQTLGPVVQGVTNQIGFVATQNTNQVPTVYGQTIPRSDFIGINHRAYLFARLTGTYTFTFKRTDDIALIWVGKDAYSGYTRENSNDVWDYYSAGDGTAVRTYTTTLVQGTYYPIRVLYGNAQGNGLPWMFSIQAPDGTIIIDETTTSPNAQYLVTKVCGTAVIAGSVNSEFKPFGSETADAALPSFL